MREITALIFVTFAVMTLGAHKLDYTVYRAVGKAYKIMYKAKDWSGANTTCVTQEGAKLAVPKSKEDFLVLQHLVRDMYFPDVEGANFKLLVWLGINNLEDYRVWKNVDGQDIENTGFHDWSDGNGESRPEPEEPHCVGMDAYNPGLRDWWCHLNQPYVCEKTL